ncbi:MAG: TIM barrel protein [Chloroflexi bacterium]|nr:TIM barrel protein [Chloroflexota bacterium]MCL5274706.1 TIM barrel protein [Chloroflexota bacterium]
MTKIKQSLAWWCFNREGVDARRFFAEAKKIGYAAVELLPRELWDAAREAGLVIAAHGGHASLTDGLNRRENHRQIEDEIHRNLDLAVQYQIQNLIVFSGNRRGLSDEEGAANTVEGLRRVAKAAEDKSVTLVLELLNSKVDHKDYQCDHTAWGVEVTKAVNSPRVKLLYDIYHMQIMEGDVIRTLSDAIDRIGHFHTAGNPGRRDMDDTQELNYPAIIRAIAQTDYASYIGHEFIPKGDVYTAIRAAYRLCDL